MNFSPDVSAVLSTLSINNIIIYPLPYHRAAVRLLPPINYVAGCHDLTCVRVLSLYLSELFMSKWSRREA